MNSERERLFGLLPTGEKVCAFTLRNSSGMVAKIIDYGATLTELHVPNARGDVVDVVLGFSNLDGYLGFHPFFGSTIGRISGRLTGGNFTLDGRTYNLAKNDPPNHLHGGKSGFDKRLWNAQPFVDAHGSHALKLARLSRDGEEGYPGNVEVAVTYTLTGRNELVIEYRATTDKATPLSLTNHSYFNLAGEGSCSIESHQLQIHSDAITATDAPMTQLGYLKEVTGKPNDLRNPHPLGKVIPGLLNQHGDNYLVRRQKTGELTPAARLVDAASGRVLEIFTTEACLQLYCAAVLDGSLTGKSGGKYQKFGGVCLECQGYPDGPNTPALGDIILRPGATYRQTTLHRFSHL